MTDRLDPFTACLGSPDAEREAGTCARCQQWTTDGRAYWVPKNSGPDLRLILHASRAECHPGTRSAR